MVNARFQILGEFKPCPEYLNSSDDENAGTSDHTYGKRN